MFSKRDPSGLLRMFDIPDVEVPKPKLKKIDGEWWCSDNTTIRIADTPVSAYYRWLMRWILNSRHYRGPAL